MLFSMRPSDVLATPSGQYFAAASSNWVSVAQGLHADNSTPAVAGWMTMALRMSSLDLTAKLANFNVRLTPASLYSASSGMGVWDLKTNTLALPPGFKLQVACCTWHVARAAASQACGVQGAGCTCTPCCRTWQGGLPKGYCMRWLVAAARRLIHACAASDGTMPSPSPPCHASLMPSLWGPCLWLRL